MLKLLLIFPWIGAAAAAWWYTETNGSVIKKHDANLYEELKDDKDGKKAEECKTKLEDSKTLLSESELKLANLKKKDKDDLTTEDEAAMKILETDTIPKQKKTVEALQCVGGKLWMPVFSISNMAWFFGILLGAGLIGHLITKKLLSLFSENKE